MAWTNKRVEGDIEKQGGIEVGLLWGVVEIIADIFLEVGLTIMNLLFLTSQRQWWNELNTTLFQGN